ncbi:MAG: DUF882 domain-containing protein [Alphaproteobacteria bacterium]
MITRRGFISSLSAAAVVAPTLLIPSNRMGELVDRSLPMPRRSLSFYNIHTGESLNRCVYWIDGQYQPEPLAAIHNLFRDHRNNQEREIDPKLIDMLASLSHKLEAGHKPFHLVSGYRSPASNAMLHNASTGVARNSQHLYGRAADIFVEGYSLSQLQKAAKSLKAGGVGRYSQFVHVDTGRVRYWGMT